ncbi:MAG TPA: DMT family transporter [Thermoanaerobaculia bacterium]|nr:DMT family transporter [Thermoanaerobaculia bacterium]
MTARTAGLTAVALVAFAANSWLCRAALRGGAIDPASFTAVRIGCGALVLVALARRGGGASGRGGSWASAAALFVYAIAFSLAYLELDAGVGALVLFGAVQLTMLAGGLLGGQRPGPADLVGMALALAGLALLAAPGRAGADPLAAAGMAAAGVAWGVYSLRGRSAHRPLASNAVNFARAVPGGLLALGVAAGLGAVHVSARGLALAAISGAITSGLGYAIWYAALRGLGAHEAGLVQLAVPVLAALGGVAWLGERVTLRLAAAGALVLGGIALALVARRR